MNNKYKTKQKDEILNVISNKNKEFSISDIYNALDKRVGLTTIYRCVDELISCGKVTKTVNKNNRAYYQYLVNCNKHNHFYLKCENCGDIVHIDCDCISDLSNHIYKTHSFVLNSKKTFLTGTCSKCRKE